MRHNDAIACVSVSTADLLRMPVKHGNFQKSYDCSSNTFFNHIAIIYVNLFSLFFVYPFSTPPKCSLSNSLLLFSSASIPPTTTPSSICSSFACTASFRKCNSRESSLLLALLINQRISMTFAPGTTSHAQTDWSTECTGAHQTSALVCSLRTATIGPGESSWSGCRAPSRLSTSTRRRSMEHLKQSAYQGNSTTSISG